MRDHLETLDWNKCAPGPRLVITSYSIHYTKLYELERDALARSFTRIDQSIAMAAIWTAYHLKVKAIASLTQTGSTALWMSRLNSGVPIYALTPEKAARNQMTLRITSYNVCYTKLLRIG